MAEEATNVVNIKAQPKRHTIRYRRHKIILSYLPDEKTWKWEVLFTVETYHFGKHKIKGQAERFARERIDALLGEPHK